MTISLKRMAMMIAMIMTIGIALMSCGSDEPKSNNDVDKMLIGTWLLENDSNNILTIYFRGSRFTLTLLDPVDGYTDTVSGSYSVAKDENGDYAITMRFDDEPDNPFKFHIEEITSKKMVLYANGVTSTWHKR